MGGENGWTDLNWYIYAFRKLLHLFSRLSINFVPTGLHSTTSFSDATNILANIILLIASENAVVEWNPIDSNLINTLQNTCGGFLNAWILSSSTGKISSVMVRDYYDMGAKICSF